MLILLTSSTCFMLQASPVSATSSNCTANGDTSPNCSFQGNYTVSGLGTTQLFITAGAGSSAWGFSDALAELTVEVHAYTSGPVRPGSLLFTWGAGADGSGGGGGVGSGNIGGDFVWECSSQMGCFEVNKSLPFTLGVPFDILVSSTAYSSCPRDVPSYFLCSDGGSESTLTLSLLDDYGRPVTILDAEATPAPVPEPRFLGFGAVLMLAAVRVLAGAGRRTSRSHQFFATENALLDPTNPSSQRRQGGHPKNE